MGWLARKDVEASSGSVVGTGEPVMSVGGVEYRESVFPLPVVEGPPGLDLGEAVRLFQDDIVRGLAKGDSVQSGLGFGGFNLVGQLQGARSGKVTPVWVKEHRLEIREAFWSLVDRGKMTSSEKVEWAQLLGPSPMSSKEDGRYLASTLVKMGFEKVLDRHFREGALLTTGAEPAVLDVECEVSDGTDEDEAD